MSVLYQLLYLLRVRPWERDGIAPQLRGLIEGPEALPPTLRPQDFHGADRAPARSAVSALPGTAVTRS